MNALVCQLSADCAAQAPADSAAPAAALPGARVSATRGFTFKRVAPDPNGGKTVGAATSATAPAAMGSAALAARAPSANLRLDFASASSELNAGSRQRLNKLASALATSRLAAKRIRIEGHTDASGNAMANRLLSQRRAQAAADYLIAAGVASNRIEVIGYGAAQPLPGVSATAPENRRVMATVLN